MSTAESDKVLSVGELTRQVKGLLEQAFRAVWVEGEIASLSRPASGHLYLTLKDSEASVRAVIWRSTALRLRFDLHEGLDVIARGRLSVYPPRGEYQLSIDDLQPKGLGAQELALRQLKDKLFKRGYFDPARKRPLPVFPRRVALVTSPSGAAVRDMLEILARRWPVAEIWVCPVRVQGDGAAEEIAGQLRRLSGFRERGVTPPDVVVIGRGGGSAEDLWAFNAECVADAVFACRIPVVSAVGHEIDLTLADLVADRRALTPSEAAELVVPNRVEMLETVRGFENQLRQSVIQRLRTARERLDDLAERKAFRLPLELVRDQEQRLDEWSDRLRRAVGLRLERSRQRLQARAAQLDGLSPLNVLSRGYSVTCKETEKGVVRSPDQLRIGDRLVTTVQHGRIVSRVEALETQLCTAAS